MARAAAAKLHLVASARQAADPKKNSYLKTAI